MERSLDSHSKDHKHVVKGAEVFVGGLARNVTENKIRELFTTCGEILEVRMIMDNGGLSKGYGFVRFKTKESAEKAIKEKSGILLEGKKIGVLPSTDQVTLFFGNLRKDWTPDEFDKLVRQAFQDVASVELAMPLNSGDLPPGKKQQNRGFAFVKFLFHGAAARAHRTGSKPEFVLAGNWHPLVEWAHDEPEVDPDELAKIKVLFVRNLPTNADEDYLRKLFEPLGELDKVVLSKKGRASVGFVHFAKRSDLDNALNQMNEKTVQGPNKGPDFKIQVEIAKPFDKTKKRPRDEPIAKISTKTPSQTKFVRDEQPGNSFAGRASKAPKVGYSFEESAAADPYEAAVVSLPVAVKERLLRILRLGIATRFDIDIHCITSLRELPESSAISILDQFMLSGAEKHDKASYLAGLVSRHRVDRLGLSRNPLHLSTVGDTSRASELSGFSSRVHLPGADSLATRASTAVPRYGSYTSYYSSLSSDYPPPTHQSSYGKLEERSPAASYLTSSSLSTYGKLGLDPHHTAAAGGASPPPPSRPQVRFDPFTGKPYKFDPFTGEPILPETQQTRGPGNRY